MLRLDAKTGWKVKEKYAQAEPDIFDRAISSHYDLLHADERLVQLLQKGLLAMAEVRMKTSCRNYHSLSCQRLKTKPMNDMIQMREKKDWQSKADCLMGEETLRYPSRMQRKAGL